MDAFNLPNLTSYITYARQHRHPKISDEAAEDLICGYVEMHRKGNFPGSSKKVSSIYSQIQFLYSMLTSYTRKKSNGISHTSTKECI